MTDSEIHEALARAQYEELYVTNSSRATPWDSVHYSVRQMCRLDTAHLVPVVRRIMADNSA